MHQEDKQLAFRSAWIFETIVLKDKRLLDKNIATLLIQNLSTLNNWSCTRSYFKVVRCLKSSKAKASQVDNTEYDIITQLSFSWLIDSACSIAVLTNCMDILDQLNGKYAWVKVKLYAQVKILIENKSTPAINSRSSKILKKCK